MFFFGMLQERPHGMTTITFADEMMMAHLLENNPQDWKDENPFALASTLGNLSEVLCDPSNCPQIGHHAIWSNFIVQCG
jgi:hypothetical protein